jgi:hypothetical protein
MLRSLTPGDSGAKREGYAPVTNLMLPAGEYLRTISSPNCVPYGDTLTITPNRPAEPLHYRLFCR